MNAPKDLMMDAVNPCLAADCMADLVALIGISSSQGARAGTDLKSRSNFPHKMMVIRFPLVMYRSIIIPCSNKASIKSYNIQTPQNIMYRELYTSYYMTG